jgi:POT family proton-dependent oligopeptide transporter
MGMGMGMGEKHHPTKAKALDGQPGSLMVEMTKEHHIVQQQHSTNDHQGFSHSSSSSAARDPMKFSYEDLPRVFALIAVCLMAVCFWAVFEQQGNTLAQYADHNVNRRVTFGNKLLFEIPTEYIQSINPIFILILTPVVNTLWRKQSRKGSEPKPLTKMSIGCFLLALGYAVLALAELLLSDHISGGGDETKQGEGGGEESKVSIIWIVLSLGLSTLGELYLSPVGLSFVSAVAPPYMTSLSLGFWMLASFGGNFLAGHLGAMYPYMSHSSFFTVLILMALANSLVLALMSKPLSKKLEL